MIMMTRQWTTILMACVICAFIIGASLPSIAAVAGVTHDFLTEIVCVRCVTSSHLASRVIQTSEVVDSSIKGADIADKTIFNNLILDGAITTPKVADIQVTGTHILDDQVESDDAVKSQLCTEFGGGHCPDNRCLNAPTIKGFTTIGTGGWTGNGVVSYSNADSLCNTFGPPGSHMCTVGELETIVGCSGGVVTNTGWYASRYLRDCRSWTSGAAADIGPLYGTAGFTTAACNTRHQIICC